MTTRKPRVQIYRANDGWRWRYINGSRKMLAASGRAYTRRSDAIHGLELVTGGEVCIDYEYNMGSLYRSGSILAAATVEVLP